MIMVPALVASLLAYAPVASAQPEWKHRSAQEQRSVPGHALKARTATVTATHALTTAARVTWPVAGTATAALAPKGGVRTAAASAAPHRAGALPVWVSPSKKAKSTTPASVAVQVFDQQTTGRAHIDGLALRLTPATAGRTEVKVDYSGFRYAFGGDWASRLRLVRLPDCALTTPDRAGCQGRTPLKTANDVKAGTLTADVDIQASTLLAATAAPSGSAGDFTATSLSPSSTWSVSDQTGGFSWSYPLRVPPAPGGPSPQIALGYSSQAVDGKTVETNNQTSWVGEGFDYAPGFIERRYHPCSEDNTTPKHNDECWGYDNATMSLNGQSTELIRDDATGNWQPKNDDGSKVEKLTGASNTDDNGEHWRVTTPDGTQYYFGLNHLPGWTTNAAVTNSTWTVPVYGDDSTDPCHKSTAESSFCDQAWRWNLDYVVDPHGTASTFWYTPETNYYRRYVTQLTDGKPNGTVTKYTRGGYLDHIDYGVRSSAIYSSSAPARVNFKTVERCIPDSGFDCADTKFTKANASHWPDVPYDENCASSDPCNDNYAPTFWSRKRLSLITTQIYSGGYKNVDTWTLHQQMNPPGDGTAPALWLQSITHEGDVGTTPVSTPDVVFDGIQRDNRVDATEGDPPLTKWRVDAVKNETGGQISVTYADQDCTAGNTPSPDSNTKRCFPQYWTPEGNTTPKRDWFHKYVVAQVAARDLTGGAPDDVTSYSYSDPAWHYDDDDGLTKEKYKTWSQFRGFGHVTVTHGDSSGPQSKVAYTYFQGMDGDKQSDGSTRHAKVTDSEDPDGITDADQYEGATREEIHYDGSNAVTATISDPWSHQTGKRVRTWDGTASTTTSNVTAQHERTKMSDGSWQRTETDNTYDPTTGLVQTVSDLGDTAKSGDEECTRTTYAQDSSKWMLSFPSRVEVVDKACDATTSRPTDVISDVRKSYDGNVWNTAPTKGDVTKAERLDGWDVGGTTGPHYAVTGTSTFDVYGRPLRHRPGEQEDHHRLHAHHRSRHQDHCHERARPRRHDHRRPVMGPADRDKGPEQQDHRSGVRPTRATHRCVAARPGQGDAEREHEVRVPDPHEWRHRGLDQHAAQRRRELYDRVRPVRRPAAAAPVPGGGTGRRACHHRHPVRQPRARRREQQRLLQRERPRHHAVHADELC